MEKSVIDMYQVFIKTERKVVYLRPGRGREESSRRYSRQSGVRMDTGMRGKQVKH